MIGDVNYVSRALFSESGSWCWAALEWEHRNVILKTLKMEWNRTWIALPLLRDPAAEHELYPVLVSSGMIQLGGMQLRTKGIQELT